MCFWLHPTSPTATTTTSEWNILHSPAPLHSFQGHVWYLADAGILLLVYFFFNSLLPFLKRKRKRTGLAGEEGWIVFFKASALVHLSPQRWCDVVGQRWRLLPEVTALFCRKYVKDNIFHIWKQPDLCYSVHQSQEQVLDKGATVSSNVFVPILSVSLLFVISNLGSKPAWLYSMFSIWSHFIPCSLYSVPPKFPTYSIWFLLDYQFFLHEYYSASRGLTPLLSSCWFVEGFRALFHCCPFPDTLDHSVR